MVAQVVVGPRSRMTSGEPVVDRLLVGRNIVNPLGLTPRQYVARKARDCRRRARELRLQLAASRPCHQVPAVVGLRAAIGARSVLAAVGLTVAVGSPQVGFAASRLACARSSWPLPP